MNIRKYVSADLYIQLEGRGLLPRKTGRSTNRYRHLGDVISLGPNNHAEENDIPTVADNDGSFVDVTGASTLAQVSDVI